MNLIKATLNENGSMLIATKYTIPVPKSLQSLTAGKEGRKVVAGLRPENILDAHRPSRGETAQITAEVEIAEPLGHEVVAHARIGDDILVAKLEPHHIPKTGDKIELVLELETLHLFDAETESSL